MLYILYYIYIYVFIFIYVYVYILNICNICICYVNTKLHNSKFHGFSIMRHNIKTT